MLLSTVNTVLAENGLNLELVHKFDLPDVLLSESEVVVLGENLELVWQFVRTHFVHLEQIYFVYLFTHVKVPHSIQLPSQAVYRLISPDCGKGSLVMCWRVTSKYYKDKDKQIDLML